MKNKSYLFWIKLLFIFLLIKGGSFFLNQMQLLIYTGFILLFSSFLFYFKKDFFKKLGLFWSKDKIGFRICFIYVLVPAFLVLIFHSLEGIYEVQYLFQNMLYHHEKGFSYMTILVIFIVPFYEELFFRGSLPLSMPFKNSYMRIWYGALIFVFFHISVDLSLWKESLMHWKIPLPIGPFLLGLVCGWIREKQKSLWPCVFFHMLANGAWPLWLYALPPWAHAWFFIPF